MTINYTLTPDFAFFSFFISFSQLCSILIGLISKDRGLFSYIFMVIIPYIYIVFIRGYFIRKDLMLNEVLLHINFKCIATNDIGRIIKKVHIDQSINQKYANNDKPFPGNNRYYVSSKYNKILINRLKYFQITNPSVDFEICDYELWKKIKIGSMYRLKYYKHDKSRIILQIDEFKYQEELNKYIINDLSNLIVEYL